MISSILEKPYRSIVIDHLLVTDDNDNKILLINPDDILTAAPKQYKALQTPRQHQFNSPLPPDWERVYEPLNFVNSTMYDNIMAEPSEAEWDEVLCSCNVDTAAGISGIGYCLIKKVNSKIHTILRSFADTLF